MNLKKLITISMVSILTVLLVGCSTDAETDAKIEKKDTLEVAVGSTFPWGFSEDDKLQGFVIDLWDEISNRMDMEINYTQYGNSEGLYGAMDAGRADIVASQVSITDGIKDKYNFTIPFAHNLIKMLVREDDNATSIEDLHGRKVCIEPGGKLSEFFNKYNEDLSDEDKLDLVFTEGSIWEEIELDRFDSFPITVLSFDARQAKGESRSLKLIGDPIIVEKNVFPVSKDLDKDILDTINKTLQAMLDDGTVTKISETWYDRDITKEIY